MQANFRFWILDFGLKSKIWWALCLSLALIIPHASALAATADDHYAKGLKLYVDGKYGNALNEVVKALEQDSHHQPAQQLQSILKEEMQVASEPANPKAPQQQVKRLKTALTSAEQRVSALVREQQQTRKEAARLQEELIVAQRRTQESTGKASGELSQLQRSSRMAEQMLAGTNRELTAARRERAELDKRLSKTQQELAAAKQAIESSKGKRGAQEPLRPMPQREVVAKPVDDDPLRQTKADLESRYAGLYRNLHADYTALQRRYEDLEQGRRKEAGDLRAENVRLHDRNQQLMQELGTVQERLGTVPGLRLQMQEADQSHREELSGVRSELKRSQATQFQVTQELEEKRQKLAEQSASMASVQERVSNLERSRGELLKVNAMLEEELNERSAQLAQINKQFLEAERTHDVELAHRSELEQALRAKHQELERAEQRLSEARGVQTALEDRLREGERTEVKLSDELQRMSAVESERNQLKADVNAQENQMIRLQGELERLRRERADFEETKLAFREKKTQAEQLQGEIDRITRELITTRASLQQAQSDLQQREEEAMVERRGYQLQLDRFQRELQTARSAHQELIQQIVEERNRQGSSAEPSESRAPSTPRPTVDLGSSGASQEPVVVGEPAPLTMAPPPLSKPEIASAPVAAAPEASEEMVSPERYPVKVHQVNSDSGIMVLSRDGLEWAEEGTRMLLAGEDESRVATVQLTDVDREGFAVVQITQRLMPSGNIRKGDTLFAHPLLRLTPD
jgi:chromosome segregation ATPase